MNILGRCGGEQLKKKQERPTTLKAHGQGYRLTVIDVLVKDFDKIPGIHP